MIKHLVIAGGGTAGWMSAAMFCRFFKNSNLKITLVESDDISTVGVGEATIPHLRYFNQKLGINEHEFMRETSATFKLGIEFANWKNIGHSYVHPFGTMGFPTKQAPFYHYWSRAKSLGLEFQADKFSIATHMAKLGRFAYPSKNKSELASTFSYAFHIDASKYAAYLRKYCEKNFENFERIEGKIEYVNRDSHTGDIENIKLENELIIAGDFYLDCSGFRSLLLSKTLNVAPVDLSEHLPCDSAIAAPTNDIYPDMPYSRATAHTAGWQWKIPLKHRTGNGCVYSKEFMSDEQALQQFAEGLSGDTLVEPRVIRFKARRMLQSWSHNCVAIGLSSGFLEPLESTGIHLIQIAIMKLTELLPAHSNFEAERAEFNEQMRDEYEKIRDFLVLHYCITERDDSPFWQYIRNMSLPHSLEQRIGLIREHGVIDTYQHGLFLESSWAYVYFGQGGQFKNTTNRTNHLSDLELLKQINDFQSEIKTSSEKIPMQNSILNKIYAGTTSESWPEAAMSFYGVFS